LNRESLGEAFEFTLAPPGWLAGSGNSDILQKQALRHNWIEEYTETKYLVTQDIIRWA